MAKTAEAKKKRKKKGLNLKPLDDRIVVERLDAEEITSGGIVLPDSAREKPQEGRVLAVGPGSLNDSGKRTRPDVSVGDKVLFGKYSGSEVKVSGEEIVIIRESDVLARLEQ